MPSYKDHLLHMHTLWFVLFFGLLPQLRHKKNLTPTHNMERGQSHISRQLYFTLCFTKAIRTTTDTKCTRQI